MQERDLSWPQVNMSEVDKDWWTKVMQSTGIYQDYFDNQLSDSEDFTIRAIVHIIHNKPREVIKQYLEGSQQLDRALDIQRDLKSDDPNQRDLGRQEIIRMIEEYNKEVSYGS